MQVSTTLIPRDAVSPQGDQNEVVDVAVVIDVLRATSVMATALAAGAARIVTCREIDEARSLASKISPPPLLCGERGCMPIEGFDLGNSPAEYRAQRVQGRTLVLTTTNGTSAIQSASRAERLITASFLNLSAVIDSLRSSDRLRLVCAGTGGEITAEDVLLAGAILCACETRFDAEVVDDDSMIARELWHSWFPGRDGSAEGPWPGRGELSDRLRETRGGQNLLGAGYEPDLDLCATVDCCGGVPSRVGSAPTSFALQAT